MANPNRSRRIRRFVRVAKALLGMALLFLEVLRQVLDLSR